MRVKDTTIPSTFVKLDTNVTAADSCVNVHDQHVFRQNHNALLAKRVRKDLVSQICGSGYPTFMSRFAPDEEGRARLMSIPLYVTQQTQELRFWCRAEKSPMNAGSSLAEDPVLYVVIREPQLAYMGSITDYSITVSAASGAAASYNVDVPLPPKSGEVGLHFGRVPYIMDIYLKSFVDDTYSLYAALAVSDIGRDYFTAAAATAAINNVVYTSTVENEPRTISGIISLGGAPRFYVDKPWSQLPSLSDTVTICEVLGVVLMSYGVQELEVTDFGAEYGI